MFFKPNTTDHFSDDPIVHGDILDRVLKSADSDGIPRLHRAGTSRCELQKEPVKPDRLLAQSAKTGTEFAGNVSPVLLLGVCAVAMLCLSVFVLFG